MKNKALIVGLLSMLSLVSVANTIAFIPKGNNNYVIGSISSNAKPCISREDLEIMIIEEEDVTQVNTGCITDFSGLFSMMSFNQDISGWDVSSGVDFSGMFASNPTFNQNINDWDVSNGVYFSGMFQEAQSFNQPLNKWDVSNGRYFNKMFSASDFVVVFNQDISDWNVSNGVDFNRMFAYNEVFNQDLSSWNVGKGENFSRMFLGSAMFSYNISMWDTTSATTWDFFANNSNLSCYDKPGKFTGGC